MRHRKNREILGRTSSHRKATLAALVNGLIEQKRIKTTLTKAKAARRLADRMVTLGKRSTLAARRRALSALQHKEHVSRLFDEIAPQCADRAGGYTRVVRLGRRKSDSSEMAILEWVDIAPPEKKPKSEKKAKE
jgi:large subunit ribosomal protein L17